MSLSVLVACEYSGTVRDAFIAAGHHAVSCDLLPTDVPGPHYQGDVFDIINDGWDLLVAHPPCTYLTSSGNRWLHTSEPSASGALTGPARWAALVEGATFVRRLLEAPIPRIAVENPRMNRHAKAIVGRGPDQIVHPWMFGHPETKATGLWLKNLPPLVATDDVRDIMAALPTRERNRIHYTPPSADRWKIRSTTYPGLAAAMAQQWSDTAEAVA